MRPWVTAAHFREELYIPKLCMGQYRPRLCVAIHMLHDTTSWAFFKDFLYKRYLEGRLRHFDVA